MILSSKFRDLTFKVSYLNKVLYLQINSLKCIIVFTSLLHLNVYFAHKCWRIAWFVLTLYVQRKMSLGNIGPIYVPGEIIGDQWPECKCKCQWPGDIYVQGLSVHGVHACMRGFVLELLKLYWEMMGR